MIRTTLMRTRCAFSSSCTTRCPGRSPVDLRAAGAAILPGVANDNVLGNPEPGTIRQATIDDDFATSPGVPPHGPDDGTLPQGFHLLGPLPSGQAPFAVQDPFTAGIPAGTPMIRTANLEYVRFFPVR